VTGRIILLVNALIIVGRKPQDMGAIGEAVGRIILGFGPMIVGGGLILFLVLKRDNT